MPASDESMKREGMQPIFPPISEEDRQLATELIRQLNEHGLESLLARLDEDAHSESSDITETTKKTQSVIQLGQVVTAKDYDDAIGKRWKKNPFGHMGLSLQDAARIAERLKVKKEGA